MDIRTLRTRTALKESLLSWMKEKPISEISAADISSRAGVDRATFYRHYKSVDAIMCDLEQDHLEKFRKLMETKDLFGEELIRTVLDQIEKGNAINKTAAVSYFSGRFIDDMSQIARECAFDAWQKRMPRAAAQEVDLALSTVISAAVHAVKQADRYDRATVVRYIGNMINGIVKMYDEAPEADLSQDKAAERERIRKEQIAMMAGGVSAYIVDPETERFQIISQNSYLAENYTSDEDFNTSISRYIQKDVYAPDRKAVAEKINVPAIVKALENNDVDLDTDDYIPYHLVEKVGDIRSFYDRSPKFADLAHGFADSELVRPEDRENLRAFYPSAAALRERMKDRKLDSMLFKRNYGGEWLWTEINVAKCEDADKEAHNVFVGFVEKDREVKERTERFKEEDEIQKLIDNITCIVLK